MLYQNNGLVNNPTLNLGFNSDRVCAELSLFSRAYTPDFARRPLVYNFNGAFREELNDRLSNVGSFRGFRASDAYFGKNSCATNLILPSVRAEAVNMSTFSESWTFILVITTVKNSMPHTGMSSLTRREIFSGYVADDPVSPMLMNGNKSDFTNHNAILVTTHYTEFNISDDIMKPLSSGVDADIIPQQVAANIQRDGTALASLRPDLLLSGVTPDDGIYSSKLAMSPVPLNQNAKRAENIPVAYNIPVAHVSKLVNNLADSLVDTDFNNTSGCGDALSTLTSNYSARLQPGYCTASVLNSWANVINPNKPFTIGDLINAFPGDSLSLVTYEQPHGQTCDLVDTMAPTPQNQMSSMISMCLPPMLVEYGIADITLSYRSRDPSCDGIHKGSYRWGDNTKPLAPVSQERFAGILSAFIDELITNVFMMICANVGEFVVNISSSVCGTTLVDLKLLDWDANQNGFALTNNRLGGLNSSMIGSEEISTGNQIQLSNILQDCVNTAKINEQFIPRVY